jgi:SAM-dependent methyltransferase
LNNIITLQVLALKQHKDVGEMLRQQIENSAAYVLPFIAGVQPITSATKVLEIGCGEGGVLKPFFDMGCQCVGVDLDPLRIPRAKEFYGEAEQQGKITFLLQNVYDESFVAKYKHHFDVIILKDVIEHIPNQQAFIGHLKNLLAPRGVVFFGFPPWWMPFGGHQQLCEGRLSKLPWYHVLPKGLYKRILKAGGESDTTIICLEEIWDTKILIEQLERYYKNNGFVVARKQWFLINPIYKYKFGLEPRKQFWLLGAIPYLRNIWTTCAYYVVRLG